MRYRKETPYHDPQQIGNLMGGQIAAKQSPAFSNKGKEETIWLRLHYKNTHTLVRSHAAQWNKQLLEQFPREEKKVMSKRHSKEKQEVVRHIDSKEYSAKDIKATHLDTFFVLMKMFGNFLNTNASKKLIDARFLTNNAAIAKMRGLSTKTVIDHMHRLLRSGMISKKTFRGTNASYCIEFNPAILAADVDLQWCLHLVKKWQKEHNYAVDIPTETVNAIYSSSPSFSYASPSGYITFRNNIVVYQNIQDKNTNRSGFLSEGGNLKSFPPSPPSTQEQGNTEAETGRSAPSAGPGAKIYRGAGQDTDFYVQLCWRMAFSVFARWWKPNFKNGKYTSREIETAKYFIADYIDCASGQVPQDISHIVNKFSLIINKNARVMHRMPNGFCPKPSWYFDPQSKCSDGSAAGFLKAKEKFEVDVKNKFDTRWKTFNENIKIAVDFIKKFYKEDAGPKAAIYHRATQRLSKMQDEYFLKFFLISVNDKEHCNSENIYAHRQEYFNKPN